MNPDLSRRVALVMGTDVLLALDVGARLKLASAVEAADSYDALPVWVRQLVDRAEAEARARRDTK